MDKKSIFRLMVPEGESIMASEIRQQAVRAESWEITSQPHAESKGKQEVRQGYKLSKPPHPMPHSDILPPSPKGSTPPNNATYRENKCPNSWNLGGHFSFQPLHTYSTKFCSFPRLLALTSCLKRAFSTFLHTLIFNLSLALTACVCFSVITLAWGLLCIKNAAI